jgi:hypothetical protein
MRTKLYKQIKYNWTLMKSRGKVLIKIIVERSRALTESEH